MTGEIAALYRHPVKGLTPEPLAEAVLHAGGYFPFDRLYAVEDGPSGFDPLAPAHMSKQKFAVLAKTPILAKARTAYDSDTGRFAVQAEGLEPLSADLGSPEGRAALADWLHLLAGDELRGPLRVLAAPRYHRFMDSRRGFVSILNLASVADLARRLDRPVDPLRFRANVHISGWPPWCEYETQGQTITLGEAQLEVLDDTDRCAATAANPVTGERDMDVVAELFTAYGHINCGVYARVNEGGRIAVGHRATLVTP